MLTKRKSTWMLVILIAMLAIALPASAAPSVPDNYCTIVNWQAVAGGYSVSATGAGRYARIYDLTTNSVVVATDFGLNATVYNWPLVSLTQGDTYQVQVSHTSLTTGFSTTGCTFTPDTPPLGVEIDYFTAIRQGPGAVLVEWQTVSELDTSWFDLYRGAGASPGVLIYSVPGHPGSQYGYTYQFTDNHQRLRVGTYTLIVWEVNNSFHEYIVKVTDTK